MISLKDRLLSYEGFVDNEYLDKYVQLVERNRRTPRRGKDINSHHIVPRSWFKIHKQTVDNSLSNLVNLVYRNHTLAHYYLCLCTEGQLQYANELALILLVSRKKLNISDKLLVQGLPLYNNIYEDYLQKKQSCYKLYEEITE